MSNSLHTKFCPACQQTKSLDDFGLARSRKDGRASYCKLCTKARNELYYEKNSEAVLAKAKARKKPRHGNWIRNKHGRKSGYSAGCRCVLCKRAWAEYARKNYRDRKEQVKGWLRAIKQPALSI